MQILANIEPQQIFSGKGHIGVSGDDDRHTRVGPAVDGLYLFGVDMDTAMAHPVCAPLMQGVPLIGKKDTPVHIVHPITGRVGRGHMVAFFVFDGVDAGGCLEVICTRGDGATPPYDPLSVYGIKSSVAAPFTN